MASGWSSHPAARRDVLCGVMDYCFCGLMMIVCKMFYCCALHSVLPEVCVGMPKVWLQSIILAHSNCLNIIKKLN